MPVGLEIEQQWLCSTVKLHNPIDTFIQLAYQDIPEGQALYYVFQDNKTKGSLCFNNDF